MTEEETKSPPFVLFYGMTTVFLVLTFFTILLALATARNLSLRAWSAAGASGVVSVLLVYVTVRISRPLFELVRRFPVSTCLKIAAIAIFYAVLFHLKRTGALPFL